MRARRSDRLRSGVGRRRPLAAASLAALVLALGCGRAESRPSEEPPPPRVEVVTVRPEPLRDAVELVGQLVSVESVTLKPELSGVIASIGFQEGEAVAEGDVLFRLRDEEQRARLRVAVAEAQLAEEVYERTRRLADRDVSSAAQLDRAAAELEVARANVELARVNLDRTEVRAPFDGVMGERHVSPGDRIDTETELARIDATAELECVFTVPERALALARTGIPVSLRVAPYPGETFEGEVFFIAPALDPETRRMTMKARVPNPDGRLRPGLFASVKVEVARVEEALLLPESALVHDRFGSFVWKVGEEDVAERVPVEPGLRQGGRVEIREGLEPGDTVVAVGTHKVQAGRPVAAVRAGEAGGVESTELARDPAGVDGEGT